MKLKLTSWNATDIFINKMPSEEDKLIFQPLIELLQQADPEPVLAQWDALALSWFTVCLFVCFNWLVLFASVLANLLHSHLSPSHYRRAWVSVRRTSSCSMGRCCFVLIHSRGILKPEETSCLVLDHCFLCLWYATFVKGEIRKTWHPGEFYTVMRCTVY